MASNDYDDLLESFMNNSQKVYNEDKDALEKKSGNLPTSYNVTSKDEKKDSKSNKSSNRKKRKPKKPINLIFNYVLIRQNYYI